jgi:5-methylcytosine-specific restriction protein B
MRQPAQQDSNAEQWDEFMHWARRFYGWGRFDEEEREYKLDLAGRLCEVRKNLDEDPARWRALLKDAFGGPNNLVTHYTHRPFQEWCRTEPDRAARALQALWEPSRIALEGMYAFLDIFPKNLARGPGTLLNLVSYLHMARGAELYPIYQYTPITRGAKLVGYPPPSRDNDAPQMYRYALGLFDRILEEAARRELNLRDRLDAQSLVWSVSTWQAKDPPVSAWSDQDRDALRRYRAGAARPA